MASRLKEVKNVLILGSSGFIGSNIASKLSEFDLNITHCNRFKKENYNDQIIHDFAISPLEELKRRNFQYVINCIGTIDHGPFFQGGAKTVDDNLLSVINLIKSIDLNNIKRFIHLGTSEEYAPSKLKISENNNLHSETFYSFSKNTSINFLSLIAKEYGLPVTFLRPFLVYGPTQSKQRLIPYTILSCLNDREFNISLGEQERDFIYIDDFVQFLIEVMFSDQNISNEIFNVGSGEARSVKQAVMTIRDYIGKGKPIFGSFSSQKYEPPVLVADISKAKEFFMWSPTTPFHEGVIKTVEYLKKLLN